jgi:hypothetical protein
MVKLSLILMSICLLLSNQVKADESYSIIGPNNCKEFSDIADARIQYNWVVGVYSGYNLAKGISIKERDFDEGLYLYVAVKQVCEEHPEMSPEYIVKSQIEIWLKEDEESNL